MDCSHQRFEPQTESEAQPASGTTVVVVSPASLPFSVYDDEQLELIARELIPRVRG